MNVKVSVIVPVYNAEKYLPQCIESLLNQTLQECEFIFVNDGSTDRSMEILEQYKEQDERIHLISQVNSGVSLARNAGLVVAEGEYIGFVDADDYVENDLYATLYHAAVCTDCDIVVSNIESELDGHKVITKYPFPYDKVLKKDYINNELLPFFLKEDSLNTVCNKVFKKEFVNSLQFPEKVTMGEDALFNMQSFFMANSVKFINFVGYHYRNVSGSATRNISENDYFSMALEVYLSNVPKFYEGLLTLTQIDELKSIRLINNVIANIYIYLSSSKEMNLFGRIRFVKHMISHPIIRKLLDKYYGKYVVDSSDRYKKFIMEMIKKQSIIGLYIAHIYSRFKNS